jgi:hypothetical protein
MAQGGIALLAVVFALALATFNLATAIAREVVSALQQHSVDGEFGGALSFRIWQTDVYYGEALLYALTVMLVVAALFGLWQLTKRTSRTCQECRSSVPSTASVCRFCTSELPAADPGDA